MWHKQIKSDLTIRYVLFHWNQFKITHLEYSSCVQSMDCEMIRNEIRFYIQMHHCFDVFTVSYNKTNWKHIDYLRSKCSIRMSSRENRRPHTFHTYSYHEWSVCIIHRNVAHWKYQIAHNYNNNNQTFIRNRREAALPWSQTVFH